MPKVNVILLLARTPSTMSRYIDTIDVYLGFRRWDTPDRRGLVLARPIKKFPLSLSNAGVRRARDGADFDLPYRHEFSINVRVLDRSSGIANIFSGGLIEIVWKQDPGEDHGPLAMRRGRSCLKPP